MYNNSCPFLLKNYVLFCNNGYFVSKTSYFFVHLQNEKRYKPCNDVTNCVSKVFFISNGTLLENKDMTYQHVLKSQIVNKYSVSELGDQPLSANCGSPRDMGLIIIMKEGQETIFMCGSFGFQNFNFGS